MPAAEAGRKAAVALENVGFSVLFRERERIWMAI
jgi:hypothetical protein